MHSSTCNIPLFALVTMLTLTIQRYLLAQRKSIQIQREPKSYIYYTYIVLGCVTFGGHTQKLPAYD